MRKSVDDLLHFWRPRLRSLHHRFQSPQTLGVQHLGSAHEDRFEQQLLAPEVIVDERDIDARMKRTRERPLPAGRMSPRDALLFGLLFSLTGIAILGLFTNLRAAFLAFATIAIYIIVYTPMKRMSSLNTLVGAVPGALPPLIGWVAARGDGSGSARPCA